MAEKNDQKMRERAERAEKFQAKLQELLALLFASFCPI